jgi:hypothetical protein
MTCSCVGELSSSVGGEHGEVLVRNLRIVGSTGVSVSKGCFAALHCESIESYCGIVTFQIHLLLYS